MGVPGSNPGGSINLKAFLPLETDPINRIGGELRIFSKLQISGVNPNRWALSRVHCIGWFDSGRVIDPIVLDGATLPERLHSGRDHRRVPCQSCEGNQGIFVTPTADHGVGVRRPSRWHPDLARQITRRLLYGMDRQSPKPGLKGGSRDWINLDTKDAEDQRKTDERPRSPAPDRWRSGCVSSPSASG